MPSRRACGIGAPASRRERERFQRCGEAGIIAADQTRRKTMRRLFVCAAMLAFTMAASAQPVPSPVQPAPVKRTMLGKVEVPGANYDVVTALVEIAPGFKAGRHNHPGTVQYQVLDGEFWLAVDGQPEKVSKAGEFGEIKDAA